MNRLKRGDIQAPGKAQKAIENFFKESTLTALREMALRQTAHELDLREKGMCPALDAADFEKPGAQSVPSTENETHDRILIYVSPDPTTGVLIRRGRRMADYLDADCFAVCVSRHDDLSSLSKGERDVIEKHVNFARNLHIETRVWEGKDTAQTIIGFAYYNQTTQILLARRRYTWWTHLLRTNLTLRVVRKAKDIRVIIVAE